MTDEKVEAVLTKTLESMPKDATHWSTRSMAELSDISHDTVSRIWHAFGLQPHRTETFKLSTDPQFVAMAVLSGPTWLIRIARKRGRRRCVCGRAQRFDGCGADIDFGSVSISAHNQRGPLGAAHSRTSRTRAAARRGPGRRAAPAGTRARGPIARRASMAPVRAFASSTRR